jgi:hypothetical protein
MAMKKWGLQQLRTLKSSSKLLILTIQLLPERIWRYYQRKIPYLIPFSSTSMEKRAHGPGIVSVNSTWKDSISCANQFIPNKKNLEIIIESKHRWYTWFFDHRARKCSQNKTKKNYKPQE